MGWSQTDWCVVMSSLKQLRPMKLIDVRTADGSRHFLRMPKAFSAQAIAEHLTGLEGARLLCFFAGGVTEAYVDFTYQGYRFQIRNGGQEYLFFVDDPSCSDVLLLGVAYHFHQLLSD